MNFSRIYLIHAAAATIVVALVAAYLFVPIGPRNFMECREDAARTAKSKEAMYVLIGVCREKFPAQPAANTTTPSSSSSEGISWLLEFLLKAVAFGVMIVALMSVGDGLKWLYTIFRKHWATSQRLRAAVVYAAVGAIMVGIAALAHWSSPPPQPSPKELRQRTEELLRTSPVKQIP